MKDFTVKIYQQLLDALSGSDANIVTFSKAISTKHNNCVILRHDVDKLPGNSVQFAQIQAGIGVTGSYYFRILPCSFNEKAIKEIADLGHEIGYHYEDLSLTGGNVDKAYDSFCRNLEKLRKLYPVETICMHGSPASRWDSKDIWKKYDYKNLGIIGEPYFDIDFDTMFYITDTGRRWDGWKVSRRDKVPQQADWIKKGLVYNNTLSIIKAIDQHIFPNSTMLTFHPQRWTDDNIPWLKELIIQNIKNMVKRFF